MVHLAAFLKGLYGPFAGGRLAKVPLWMAVNLKLKKKCNIVAPHWLNIGESLNGYALKLQYLTFDRVSPG